MKRKYLITLSLFTLLFLTSFIEDNEKKNPSTVVLELFTSQGCSSCPKADALLGAIANDYTSKDILVLSYHVDYWNYIGWKDPFSKKEFTQKQREYALKFNDNSIYTPAVVINGQEHFVGSNRSKMMSKIKEYQQKMSPYFVALQAKKETTNSVVFQYEIEGDISDLNARIVLAIKERLTKVTRGENAHKTLSNHHIVVLESNIAEVLKKGKVVVQIPEIVNDKDKLIAFLILENNQKDILGGTKLQL
ncbi:DUF1223 domain-containing protein [Kordia zhangzhouensis]|uniref:DUF1223 domain-containing protein n=1 Tax=Kordia zhangzhouensis TaxID=1620405 RepID=UPI000699B22D|nr:DUF1223 domain-containing protein [Kordia zhangzhouensis]